MLLLINAAFNNELFFLHPNGHRRRRLRALSQALYRGHPLQHAGAEQQRSAHHHTKSTYLARATTWSRGRTYERKAGFKYDARGHHAGAFGGGMCPSLFA